ncbi:MAG: hypothetical protein A2106_05275 [Planctomycetes bacterium GWF2_40_8]|nr:MAG: hypothetical protein A2106_05275 [Planctomycetes bacterium GWF2_40_8]
MKLRHLVSYSVPVLVLYRKMQALLAKEYKKGYVRVLMYHNIPVNNFISFKRQIYYLTSRYKFLTPLQFQDFIQGKCHISGINLLLTFDDGFKSNRIVAEKILDPLGIKGIFFVLAEFPELKGENRRKKFIIKHIYGRNTTNPGISSDMKPLTWKDLEYLLSQGHAIGSHSCNHMRLSSIHSQRELYDEIIESGNILERRLGAPVIHFAYPFGDIDSINKSAMDLIKGRYTYCFSGVRGKNFYPFSNYAIKRDAISVDDPPLYVQLIIESGLDIIYRKKSKRLLALVSESTDFSD